MENVLNSDRCDVSWPVPIKTIQEHAKDGRLLATILDALAQRDKAGTGTPVTELNISVDPDPESDFVLHEDRHRRDDILQMLRHIERLHFGERSVNGRPACAGMSAVLAACVSVETLSTSISNDDANSHLPHSSTINNLVSHDPTVWPKLRNLYLSDAQLDPADVRHFLEAHRVSLRALSLYKTQTTDLHKLLDTVVSAGVSMQRFYLQYIYGPGSWGDNWYNRCYRRRYYDSGILVTPESNTWPLQEKRGGRALQIEVDETIAELLGP